MTYEQNPIPAKVQAQQDRQRTQRPHWQGPNFIPVGDKPPRKIDATVEALPITDMSQGWRGTPSPSQDSTGALDKAQGFNRRMILPMALVVIVALLFVLAWSLLLAMMGSPTLAPFMLDRLAIFLAAVSGLGFWVWSKANETDYRHSHAGVDHHRLDAMVQIRKAEIEAETEQRQAALAMSLKLLEDRDRGTD